MLNFVFVRRQNVEKFTKFEYFFKAHKMLILLVTEPPHAPELKPWSFSRRINNCVGEDNHWLFLQLCFYAQILSLFTLVLDFCQYYYFQPLARLDQVGPHSSCLTTCWFESRAALHWNELLYCQITLDLLTGSASASQEKFTTRHELALLRVSALTGMVMFAGMTSLFHTQLTGILTVSPESCKTLTCPADDDVTARVPLLLQLLILTYYSCIWVIFNLFINQRMK